MPSFLNSAPSRVRWEFQRVALAGQFSLWEFEDGFGGDCSDYNFLWEKFNKPIIDRKKLPERTSGQAWDAAATNDPRVTRTAKLTFSSKLSDPTAFQISLSPLRLEPRSCRFARVSSAERFFYLVVLRLNKPSTIFEDIVKIVPIRFQ